MNRAQLKSWKPGQSGNPSGRPKGSGTVGKLRAAISEHVPEIIATMVQKAKEGDATAARLLLERAIPALKAEELGTAVPMPDGGLADKGRAILEAAGAGNLAPGQASALLAGLGALAKLVETDELAARIAALEARHAGQP